MAENDDENFTIDLTTARRIGKTQNGGVGFWVNVVGVPYAIREMTDAHLDAVRAYLDRTGNRESPERLETVTEIDRRRVATAAAAAGDFRGSADDGRASGVLAALGWSPLSLIGTAARRVLLKEFAAVRCDEREKATSAMRDAEETLRRLPEVVHQLAPSVSVEEAKALVANVRATVEHHNEGS